MPIIHRQRADNDPFSGLFGGGGGNNQPTTATAPTDTAAADSPTGTTDVAALPTIVTTPTNTELTTTASTTDPLGLGLGGLTSLLGLSATTPSTTAPISTGATAAAPSTTTTAPAQTTTTVATAPTSVTQAASSTAASSSATPTASSGMSKTAAAVVGTLAGLIALAMIVAFVLRRWNRHKRRAARESVIFPSFESPGRAESTTEQKYVEPKEFHSSMDPFLPMTAGPAPETYHAQGAYPQQPPNIYSPKPFQPYPSPAQQVVYDYRGEPADVKQQYRQPAGHLPNLHAAGAAEPESTHDAYGGM